MIIKKTWVTGLVLFFLAGLVWGQAIDVSTDVPYHSPNDKACKGKTYSISWTANGHSELIKIRLLRQLNGSSSEILVLGTNLASSGSMNWTIPGSLPSGEGYYLDFRTMAGHYIVCTGLFYIRTCVQQATPTAQAVSRVEVSRAQLPPVHAMVFEQFEQGAISMDPASLTIKWGTHSIQVGRNETKWISIDEDSDLIDPATGGLRATVEYTLKNSMAKNFRFHVMLRFGNHAYAPVLVTFVGISSQHVTQDLVLYPANQTLPLRVEATDILIDGGSNDVRPFYFSANLHVRVFPN
jgi:hypothetical protein